MARKTVFADTYGYRKSNATRALQDAISDPSVKRIIVRDMGTPWLVDQTVFVQSNKTIVFRPGVVIQAKAGAFTDNTKPMIRAVDVENIKLIGQGNGTKQATFKMNKAEFKRRENGHALDISAVTNYTIKGLRFTGAGGDGIHIGGAGPEAKTYSKNGLISHIIADNNRRQGLSIISVENLKVQHSTFRNTRGTAPSAGIDIEPNLASDRLQNIQLKNLELRNNNGAGLKLALGQLSDTSKPISINADNLWIENNHNSGISVALWESKDNPATMPNGTVTVKNTQVVSTRGTSTIEDYSSGILLHEVPGSSYDPRNLKINFDQISIAESGNDPNFFTPIHLRGFGGKNTQAVGNVNFKDVVVRDRGQRSIIQALHGRSDGYLDEISGNIVGFNPTGVTVDFDSETAPREFSLTVRDGEQLVGPEILENGGFEQGKQAWKLSSKAATVINRGQKSQWLNIAKEGGHARQNLSDSLIPGESYVLSGRALLTEPGDVGVIGIRYRNEAGSLESVDTMIFRNHRVLDLSLGLTTPDQFSRAEIFVRKRSGLGAFWVDDLTLVAQTGGLVSRGY